MTRSLGDSPPDHLVPLPGGSWALWRRVVLRGAGFPACRVLAMAAPACAEAADRQLAQEERLEAARQRALGLVDASLDDLRAAGQWANKEERRPLLKALGALSRGKVPKSAPGPEIAAAIDAFAELRRELDLVRVKVEEAWVEALEHIAQQLREVSQDAVFREAVVWQNPHAVETALDKIAAGPGEVRNSRRRQHEELIASYLQRYSVKNDTIGFFGPVGWAWIDGQEATIDLRPGPQLVNHRSVFFENWCIESLAQTLMQERALRPWLAPRLKPTVRIAGDRTWGPPAPPQPLSADERRLLQLCDGRRRARDLVALLRADAECTLETEQEVLDALAELAKRQVIVWGLQVPLRRNPEASLRQQLEGVDDTALRESALARLEELEEARRGVVQAAGNPGALKVAIKELQTTFQRLTGSSYERNQGQAYAARGLVYEDCRRDVELTMGTRFVERLGPPLNLLLESAHWLAQELSRRTVEVLRQIHGSLRQATGSEQVPGQLLYLKGLQTLFLGAGRHPSFVAVEKAFQARWNQVLAVDPETEKRRVERRAADLRESFDQAFPGSDDPTWVLTRYFSPDIMVATADEDSFRRGDFQLVLGEIHASNSLSWSLFLSQHPEPEELFSFLRIDMDGRGEVVLPQLPKEQYTQRLNIDLVLPEFYSLDYLDELSSYDCRPLAVSELAVGEEDGQLMAYGPDGLRFNALDLFGLFLTNECSRILGWFLPRVEHQPRVTIDDLVIYRERWRFSIPELPFIQLKDPAERFVAIRRWARSQGIPRFSFFHVISETKPCYLDLDSPIYVDLFAKQLRGAFESDLTKKTFVLSEMSPRLDQLFLRDAKGNLYTSEFRMAALEIDASP